MIVIENDKPYDKMVLYYTTIINATSQSKYMDKSLIDYIIRSSNVLHNNLYIKLHSFQNSYHYLIFITSSKVFLWKTILNRKYQFCKLFVIKSHCYITRLKPVGERG